jgi:hypothetical protein
LLGLEPYLLKVNLGLPDLPDLRVRQEALGLMAILDVPLIVCIIVTDVLTQIAKAIAITELSTPSAIIMAGLEAPEVLVHQQKPGALGKPDIKVAEVL